MSFSYINKFLFLLIFIIFLSSCSSKVLYENLKIKKYDTPVVDKFDDNKINLSNNFYKKINYQDSFELSEFKNNNSYLKNLIIKNEKIFVFTDDNKLLEFEFGTGNLISTKDVNIIQNDTDSLVSVNFINDSFIVALKSGSIFRLNLKGEIIWKYKSEKTLNTPLKIFNEQIICLYIDEIVSLSWKDGSEIWMEAYNDIPVFQSKGGQIENFLNLLFYILPNNKIGAIDYNLGLIHNSEFDEIPIISSMNNTKDKIHIYQNFLIYIDEGKYIYTFNIFDNNYTLFKQNIDLGSSSILFNNAIILKEGNYLQSINVLNGKTFWLIQDKDLEKNSTILFARNYEDNLEIFLSNGDILTINNKQIVKTNNLDIGNIKDIIFTSDNILVYTDNKKTIIY